MRASMLSICLLTLAPPAAAQDLAAHWSDGHAEMNGYDLVQPRYGELRKGRAVLIFVKEPFSESARVKADPGRHPPGDVFDVMKLNAVKDFQTGVYDYNIMTSVFATLSARHGLRAGLPAKVSFSSQEWCGLLFEELRVEASSIQQTRNSYFDGEGSQRNKLELPAGGVMIEELPILVRSIPNRFLEPGQHKRLPLLPSVERARLLHRPLAWGEGTLSLSKEAKTMRVPAGAFEVYTWSAVLGGERYDYFVERKFPHRLVGWDGPDGENARLRGSTRMKYWELNREGAEKHLAELGFDGA